MFICWSHQGIGSSDQSQLTAGPISIQAGLHRRNSAGEKWNTGSPLIFFWKTISIHFLSKMTWKNFESKDLALGMHGIRTNMNQPKLSLFMVQPINGLASAPALRCWPSKAWLGRPGLWGCLSRFCTMTVLLACFPICHMSCSPQWMVFPWVYMQLCGW